MGKKKIGRSVKRNPNRAGEAEELIKAPHSFIIHKGVPGGNIIELTRDFRKLMDPFTAKNLQERKKNKLKDFVSLAGMLHVTHMCIFSHTEVGTYFKVGRLSHGPTLTFKINNFSLSRDVISSLKKQVVIERAFKHSPLVILNGFSSQESHMKLMASTFQNMFPTINLTNVNLNDIRRCVLLNYNSTNHTIDLRHYVIKVAPVGVARGVKKMVQGKIPNLSKCTDIADFLTKSGFVSESEMEEDINSHVTVSQKLVSRGNIEEGKSAIKLSELGPRLTLELMKIEDGLLDGEVLYHNFITKTDEELLQLQKKLETKRKLKIQRKSTQEANRKRKEAEKEKHKQQSMKGILKKKEATEEEEVVDDDAEYYRQEVGEEPEEELFTGQESRGVKRTKTFYDFKNKKPRFDNKNDDRFSGHKNKFNDKRDDGFSGGRKNKYDNKKDGSFSGGRKNKFDNKKDSSFSGGRKNKFDNKKDSSFSGGRKNKFDNKKDGSFSGGRKKFGNKKDSSFSTGRKNKFGNKKDDRKNSKSGFKRKSNFDKTNSANRDHRPIGGQRRK